MALPYPKIPLCVLCLNEAQRIDTSRNLSNYGTPAWKCPHKTPYPDGEIYWDIRQNQKQDSFDNVAELERQLSPPKRKNLRSILSGPTDIALRSTRTKIKRALDQILELPGMRIHLRLGNWHKYWALRCDDHVLHHLNHIVRVWNTITSGVSDAKKYADSDTIKTLQLCIPAAHARHITTSIEQNYVFTGIQDYSARSRLRQNILSLENVVIPSMETFHDNMSYLTIGLAALRELVKPIPKDKTLFQAFESSWQRPSGKSLESSENELKYASIGPEQAYGQLLLFTLRHFPFLSNERPLQKRGQKSMSAGICRQYEEKLDKLARDVGFSLTRTVSRANSEAGEIPDGRGMSTWRGGKPSIQEFRYLREISFLPVLKEALSRPATTSALVMADFLRSFLGESIYDYGNRFNTNFNSDEIDFLMRDLPVDRDDIPIPDARPIGRLPPGSMYNNIRQAKFQPDIPEETQRGIRAGQKRSHPIPAFPTSIRVPSPSSSTVRASKIIRLLHLPYTDVHRAGTNALVQEPSGEQDRWEEQPGSEDTLMVGVPTARGHELKEGRIRRQKLNKARRHRPSDRRRPEDHPDGRPVEQQKYQRARITPRRHRRQNTQGSQGGEERLRVPYENTQRAGESPEEHVEPTKRHTRHVLGDTQIAGVLSVSGEQEIMLATSQPTSSGQDDTGVQTGRGGGQFPGDQQDGGRELQQMLQTPQSHSQPEKHPQDPREQRPFDNVPRTRALGHSFEQISPTNRGRENEDRTSGQPEQQAQNVQGLDLPYDDVQRAGDIQKPAPTAPEASNHRSVAHERARSVDEERSKHRQGSRSRHRPSEQEHCERSRKEQTRDQRGGREREHISRTPGTRPDVGQSSGPQKQGRRPRTDGPTHTQPRGHQRPDQRLRIPFEAKRAGEPVPSSASGAKKADAPTLTEKLAGEKVSQQLGGQAIATASSSGKRGKKPEFPSLAQTVDDNISDVLSPEITPPGTSNTCREAEGIEVSSDGEPITVNADAGPARLSVGSNDFDDLSRHLEAAWN